MKRRYEKPEVRVVAVQTESVMLITSYNVDGSHGGKVYGNMKGERPDDDWDENNWGQND